MKKKLILIIILVIGIISIFTGSIAYYRITVKGGISASSGNAVFVLKDSNSNDLSNKTITLNNGNKVNPGDSGSFDITLDASGSTVDIYATLEIDRGSLPTNLKFYTTGDKKSELHKYYSFLEHNGTNSETLTIYWYWNPYIDDEEDNKFINKSNLEATIKVSAVQISEYVVMGNEYDGVSSANGGTKFWNDSYRPYIRTIKFDNDLSNLPSSCTEENLCWTAGYVYGDKQKQIYEYLLDSGLSVTETDEGTSTTIEKTLYNLYIVSEVPIFAPSNCKMMFSDFNRLISIDFNNNFNTSKVTDMSGMFTMCSSLISLDVSNFNTSNVTNMFIMFASCKSLTSLDLSSFDTSNATNMGSMFTCCESLTSLDLSSFNTSKVTDMVEMFGDCESLTSLDLSNFNTSNVTSMSSVFWYCSSLFSLDVSNFNTSKVTDMSGMFAGCSSLTSLDLSSFNTSNVTNMSDMFYNCSSLTSLDLSNFNTSNVTSMDSMFAKCSSLTSLDLSSFNTSNVTNMYSMFFNCSSLSTIINIMTAGVTAYYVMFSNAATVEGAQITINYIADTSDLVDKMIATKSSNSNVVKGIQL